MIDAEILRRKGWQENDIEKAFLILNSAYHNKSSKMKLLDKTIYWVVMIFLIILNLAVMGLIVPMFIFFNGAFLFFLVFLLGLIFGWLFSFMIKEIEELDGRDHIVDGFFIVAMAAVGVWVSLSLLKQISNPPNGILVALFYIVGYMIPYVIRKFKGKIITGSSKPKMPEQKNEAAVSNEYNYRSY